MRSRPTTDELGRARERLRDLGFLVPPRLRARVSMQHALVVVVCTLVGLAGAIFGMFLSMLLGALSHGLVALVLMVPTSWGAFWLAQRISRALLLVVYRRALAQFESPTRGPSGGGGSSSVAVSVGSRDGERFSSERAATHPSTRRPPR